MEFRTASVIRWQRVFRDQMFSRQAGGQGWSFKIRNNAME
jgi:hypothetical protein